ncbi:HAD hydrolase-like protein [Ureibacillus sp. FSL K6-8385]|uniref:HAD family hydrolase n=1 Tax=Ureibacillus terrenus TaxID=118246 RepID=A0A540V1N6_9BACL|nr:HAD hydrolase-like protein [Ureibacillus terrenus]MED3662047.1 HAD hydrolase-like protein [Ureibacillus terrenus]MED3764674.1 HAD hydrolase-like protein [Ureibacillus terrenus]TQE90672.1 HAD family hydrolase [Ureibacillus terrenus]
MRYIVFDFDGTLANSAQIYIDAWNAYAEKYGYRPIKFEELREIRDLDYYGKAKKYHFPMHKLSIILPKIQQYFKEHIHEVKLFEGIKEMLESLSSSGYKIAIISSNKKENIRGILERENIHSVDEVISARKLFGKDAAIRRFMKRHQLTAQDLLYVGDELRDIVACNRVGVSFMFVTWGLDGLKLIEREKPAYVANSPKEIVEQLSRKAIGE